MAGKNIAPFATTVLLLVEMFSIVDGFSVTFDPPRVDEIFVDSELNVTLCLVGAQSEEIADDVLFLRTEPDLVVGASFVSDPWSCDGFICNRTIKVTGLFLGFGEVFVLQKNE